MSGYLIPFQRKDGNNFIFRFQTGIEVRLYFVPLKKENLYAPRTIYQDIKDILECSAIDSTVIVYDTVHDLNLTKEFLGKNTSISSVEMLVELFNKILCFKDRD